MAVFVTCVLCLLVSCGNRSRTNAPASPTLQSITVSPANAFVDAGLTQQYSAAANYSDGNSKPLASVKWATSDAAIARVVESSTKTALFSGEWGRASPS